MIEFFKISSNSISFQVTKKILVYFVLSLLCVIAIRFQYGFIGLKSKIEKDIAFSVQVYKSEIQKIIEGKGRNDFAYLEPSFKVSNFISASYISDEKGKILYRYGELPKGNLKNIDQFIEKQPFSKRLFGNRVEIFSSDHLRKIGELRIYSSHSILISRWKSEALNYIFLAIVLALVICPLIFLLIRENLSRPLLNLTDKISKINYSNLKKISFEQKEENELGILAESFNTMIMHTNRFHRLLKKSLDDVEQQNFALEDTVQERTKDITNILENLGQGFMVFDEYGIIQDDVSEAAKDFFKQDLVYDNMANVLKLEDEKRKAFVKWLKQVWDGRLLFRDLVSFAPNSFIEDNRHIKLEYRAIYETVEGKVTKKVKKVICISTDVTKEKELESKAQKEKEQSQMVLLILERPIELVDLVSDYKEFSSEFSFEMDKWSLDEVFRKFHTLKASFAQFRINIMADHIHILETKITNWIDKSGERKRMLNEEEKKVVTESLEVLGDIFYEFMRGNRLIIEMANNALISDDTSHFISSKDMIYFMQRNFGRNSKVFKDFEEAFVLKPISGTFERFESVIDEISRIQGKFVDFKIESTDLKFNPEDYSEFLTSCVHLFRNAVDHGIEGPGERVDKNKPEQGMINVSFIGKSNDFFELRVRDDGRGINPGVIKEVALKLGFMKEGDLDKLSNKEIIQLIFHQGLSAKDQVSELSGRGVGMDAIKSEAEKIGGKVWVESEVDVGTTFFAELPLSSMKKSKA
ncbi:ATP-binding protein [Bacteriovoracales bacterium]|nr:ATP-binding protein [Bacteriovoracales bacterium]